MSRSLKLFKLAILTFILLLFFQVQSHAIQIVEQNYPQIAGVQIFNLAPVYRYDLDRYMQSLKANGVNTVLVRVFQNYGDRFHFGVRSKCKTGVYFQTGQACMLNNVLKDMVAAARRNDMKIYAWMATRSLSFLKDQYGYEKKFLRKPTDKKTYAASIFNLDVRNKLIALFKDLAEYDIDGILIQDDYILKYNEGASKQARKRFYVDNGEQVYTQKLFTKTGYKPFYNEWNQWKMKQLSALLNEIKTEVKMINPQIKFAVNIYYETPVYPDRGLSWYSQSIPAYVDYGFEYLAFMGYHEQIAEEMHISKYAAMKYVNESILRMKDVTHNNSRIMVKIQARSFKKGMNRAYLPSDELKQLCGIVKRYKDISYVIVPFEHLDDLKNPCFMN